MRSAISARSRACMVFTARAAPRNSRGPSSATGSLCGSTPTACTASEKLRIGRVSRRANNTASSDSTVSVPPMTSSGAADPADLGPVAALAHDQPAPVRQLRAELEAGNQHHARRRRREHRRRRVGGSAATGGGGGGAARAIAACRSVRASGAQTCAAPARRRAAAGTQTAQPSDRVARAIVTCVVLDRRDARFDRHDAPFDVAHPKHERVAARDAVGGDAHLFGRQAQAGAPAHARTASCAALGSAAARRSANAPRHAVRLASGARRRACDRSRAAKCSRPDVGAHHIRRARRQPDHHRQHRHERRRQRQRHQQRRDKPRSEGRLRSRVHQALGFTAKR